MSNLRFCWPKFGCPVQGGLVAENDRFEMLFTPAEMEGVYQLRDSLIRKRLITSMSLKIHEGRTTLLFLDERQPTNIFFHMQKIRLGNGAPEYRVGPGKIGMHLDTIDFDVAMVALAEVCRKKALANKPQYIALIQQ